MARRVRSGDFSGLSPQLNQASHRPTPTPTLDPHFQQGSSAPNRPKPKPHKPKPKPKPPPAAPPPPRTMLHGLGLRARFSPIKGITPAAALNHAVWLPAVLGEFQTSEDFGHADFETVSHGEFSVPAAGSTRARKLREADLETLTIEWNAKWLVAHGQSPGLVQGSLYRVARYKAPVELVVYLPNRDPEFRMPVTIRQITRALRQGERDTRYLTLHYKEWRDAGIARVGTKQPRKPGVTLPTTHKLRATDSLVSLSQEFYGHHGYWRLIRDANHVSKKWGAHTPLIRIKGWKVGRKIKIPRLPAEQPPGQTAQDSAPPRTAGSQTGGATA